MRNHPQQEQCYALITETTRLRMAIDEQEALPGLAAKQAAAKLWARFHRKMVELLVLTPAHNREGEKRQQATIRQHEAQHHAWRKMIEQLDEQEALEREA